jgi:polyisoprenyl-teichoic acid--peptidoglycan teichoic acid transferase
VKLGKEDRPPREGLRFLLRAVGGLTLIVVLAAATTATAGLLALDEVAQKIAQAPEIKKAPVDKAPPGKPQTILVLGSDRRWSDLKKNNPLLKQSNPARSDTILLIRLDPKQKATAVMSIPRDLKVTIPGHGTDKINAAYSTGGPNLTTRTIKALLGIKIHHVVNVNFKGFREAVNAVGCVYADVDRRYYHSNAGLPVSEHYAEINLQPGYQQLCGQKALDYVRFRHADSDIVRAARQQDFLRAAKDQISTSSLIDKRDQLIDIFGRSTQSDPALHSKSGLLKLIKLAIFSAGHPVTQIPFPATFAGDPQTGQFVEASPEAIQRAVRRFLHATPPGHGSGGRKLTRKGKATKTTVRLRNARREGEDLVAPLAARHRVSFGLYFPRKLSPEGRYTTVQPSPRVYSLRDRAGRKHRAYRLVVVQSEIDGQYYGIEGTDWKTPPLLAHPTSRRTVGKRKLLLYKDGSRLRYVAWKRKDAVYWVSNSLSLGLTNSQMIGIAASLTRV